MSDQLNAQPQNSWGVTLLRGLRRRCPSCGHGALFDGYVSVHPSCSACGLELAVYRSDDAPAYFTILFVGHIIVPAMLLLEQGSHPETWVHMVIWLPLTLGLTLLFLPRVKGALLGIQWLLKVRS